MKTLAVFCVLVCCMLVVVPVCSAGGVVFSSGGCINGSCGVSGQTVFSVPQTIVSGSFALPQVHVQQAPVVVQQPPVIVQQQAPVVLQNHCGFSSFRSNGVNVNVNSGGFFRDRISVRRGLFGRTIIRGRF